MSVLFRHFATKSTRLSFRL